MQKVTFDAEVTKAPQFEEQLKGIIAEFETEYSNAAQRNSSLKATPLLNLMREKKFTFDFIMSEFPKIADKKSTLPSSQRDIIGSIVFNAAQRTVIMQQAERARKIEGKANEKTAEADSEHQTETE